jgi:hypothetical protein
MIPGVRRLLAAVLVGIALMIAAPEVFAAAAPSPSPTPGSSATGKATSTAHASPTSEVSSDDDDNVDDGPDVAPDNSRMLWLLGGAGVVAIGAAAIVIARR